MTHAEMRDVFDKWNGAELDSYLIDISTKGANKNNVVISLCACSDVRWLVVVLERKDDEFDPQRDLLDVILDTAEQKGTGRWTAEAAFELGVPTYLISQSVFARILSGYKVCPCISELCVLRRRVVRRVVRVVSYRACFSL